MNFKPIAVAALSLLTVAACSGTRVNNSAGRATVYEDPGTSGRVQGGYSSRIRRNSVLFSRISSTSVSAAASRRSTRWTRARAKHRATTR